MHDVMRALRIIMTTLVLISVMTLCVLLYHVHTTWGWVLAATFCILNAYASIVSMHHINHLFDDRLPLPMTRAPMSAV